MKKYITSLPFLLAALLGIALPQLALAHEHDVYKIGDKTYQITIGSLNEPLIVDDKSGLDLTIAVGSGMPTMGPDGDMDGPPANTVPALGLEKTLKLEMSAGATKKTFDLTPAYGKPGGYNTVFYPTVQTTFSYRLFGSINNVPVDLSFTCNPAGNPITPADNTATKISSNVTQLSKTGAFGCAEAKSDYGFPEPSLSANDLQTQLQAAEGATNTAKGFGIAGIVLGILGLAGGAGAMMRKKV